MEKRKLNKQFTPGDVLFDDAHNKLLVWSGHIVQDAFGQDALYCLDKEDENHGVIYTGWLAFKWLTKIGNLYDPRPAR